MSYFLLFCDEMALKSEGHPIQCPESGTNYECL